MSQTQTGAPSPGGLRRALMFLFGLSQPVGRRAYAVTGFSLMALKVLLDAGGLYLAAGLVFSPLEYLQPLSLARREALGAHSWFFLPMALWALPFLWIGVALSMRRAVDAGISPWFTLLFFIPGVNYIFMLTMCFLPSQPGTPEAAPRPADSQHLATALLGAGGAVAAALAMTALTVYVFGSYGASLFFGTPFLMGALSAYLYNRQHAHSLRATVAVGSTAVLLTGLSLLLFAMEGALCIAMALPPALAVAWLGSLVGWTLTRRTPHAGSTVMLALLVLPLLAWSERGLPPRLHEVVTTIEINAPPERVFPHVVGFSELPPPSSWWFQRGVAHPRRARIEGHGVGAVRYCEFSTGPFVEPITAWEDPYRLAFDVAAQPAPLEEWSPYGRIHAPHLDGYLRSRRGEFRLVPLEGGRTRLEGTTWYELDMRPQLYWSWWSDSLIHSIHLEVLRHIRSLAEARPAQP